MKTNNVLWTSFKAIIFFTILLGIAYPAIVTCIGQLLFYDQSNGSLIVKDKKIIGSKLISQKFESGKYFSSRPSVIDYNPFPSGASNLSVTDARLKEDFETRKKEFLKNNLLGINTGVPSEMLFASGSGVDPHISKQSAMLQLNRVANVRKLNAAGKEKLKKLIDSTSQKRYFGIFGPEYINVLELNLKLEGLKK